MERRAVPRRVPIRRGTARALGLHRAAGGLRLGRRISSRDLAEFGDRWRAVHARPGVSRVVVLPKTCGHPRPFLVGDGPPVCCTRDTGHDGWHHGSDGSCWIAPSPSGRQPGGIISVDRPVTASELAAIVASVGPRLDATYGGRGLEVHVDVCPATPDTRPKPWRRWWARIRP
ncbi:hypothetical protein [Amycolatopsis stemonae]